MTSSVPTSTPMDSPSSSGPRTYRRAKRTPVDTPIGNVTEQTFWKDLGDISKAISTAEEVLHNLLPISDESQVCDAINEQIQNLGDFREKAKTLRPPKSPIITYTRKALLQQKEHSDVLQRSIASLTRIQKSLSALATRFPLSDTEGLINTHLAPPLAKLQNFLEKIYPANLENVPPLEDIALLDKALLNTTGLTPEHQVKIQKLLTHAIGNRDLNTFLKQKKAKQELSKAEKFLFDLSYTTIQAPSCSEQTLRLEKALQQSSAQQFTDSVLEYQNKEKEIRSSLSTLLSEKALRLAKRPGVKNISSALQDLSSQLSTAPYSTLTSQQLDPHRAEVLTKLGALLQTFASLKGIPKEVQKQATDLRTLTQTSGAALQKLFETISTYEASVQKNRPTISPYDFWAIRRYSDLVDELEDLANKGVSFEKESLAQLRQESSRARKGYWLFSQFFRDLSRHATGDIEFIDARRADIAEGKRGISNLAEAKEFFWEALDTSQNINEAVWPLRALGSKGISHVAYTFTEEGHSKLIEMADTFDSNAVSLADSLSSISLKPNFVRLFTQRGKELFEERYGPLTEASTLRKLHELYQQCQQEYFEANKEEFASYDNKNALHAVKAFINKPLEQMPEGSVIRQLYEWAKTEKRLARFFDQPVPMDVDAPHSPKPSQEAIPMDVDGASSPRPSEKTSENLTPPPVKERLCSELVAQVIRDIQDRMEQKLQEAFGTSEPLFISVIPRDKDPATYTIDSLLEDLKNSRVYSRSPEPLALRLIIDLSPPCEILK